MCNGGFSFDAVRRETGADVPADYAREMEALRPLEQDGLVTCDGSGVRITQAGRLFLRNIASVFDAHLSAASGRHSKAV
jgi:oxygen-independent coproporphyrinogen-3 oxidase